MCWGKIKIKNKKLWENTKQNIKIIKITLLFFYSIQFDLKMKTIKSRITPMILFFQEIFFFSSKSLIWNKKRNQKILHNLFSNGKWYALAQ